MEKLFSKPKKENLLLLRIKKESIELFESLTTHGIPNLFKTKYILVRVFWILLSVASIAASIYFVIQTVLEFFKFGINTEVRLIQSSEIQFPSILICNKNKISTNHSYEYLKKVIEKSEKGFLESFDNDDTNSTLGYYVYYKNNMDKYLARYFPAYQLFYDAANLDEIKNMSRKISDVLFWAWLSSAYDYYDSADFELIYNKKYGVCYLFNSNSSITINEAGIDNSINFELFLGQDRILNELNADKGVYIAILDKNSNPYGDLDYVIDVKVGVQTDILVEREIFEKYPYPYSSCTYNSNEPGVIDSIYYEKIVNANYSYSQSLCLDFCYLDYLNKRDGCTLLLSSIKVPNITYCRNSSLNIVDVQSVYDDLYGNNQKKNTCLDKCPLECNQVKYTSYVTTSKYDTTYFPTYKFDKSLLQDENKPEYDMVCFVISFGSMNYVSYKESPSISIFALLSNLGGILGLFLGMSVLSFFEFFEILIQLIIILYEERCSNKSKVKPSK